MTIKIGASVIALEGLEFRVLKDTDGEVQLYRKGEKVLYVPSSDLLEIGENIYHLESL